MIKNLAGRWLVHAFNPYTGAPVTGDAANITANLRLDFGASNLVDTTNPTELERGDYYFDITQAESNADHIAICPVSSTPNVIVLGSPPSLYTESDFTATQKASITAAVPALVQADVRTAVGLASANLDTQLAALPTDADVNAACDTAISDAALATAANLATVDTVVDAIKLKTDTLGGAGSISYPFIVTQTGGVAVDGALVWVSADSQGVNIIANGITDVNGLYTFHLDGGGYWFWAQHSGLNPASVYEVVS